jgi:hypothetical protein
LRVDVALIIHGSVVSIPALLALKDASQPSKREM